MTNFWKSRIYNICIIYNIYLKRRSPFYWRYQFFFQDETLSSSIAERSKCECPMISFKKYTNIIYKWSQLNPIVALLSDALQSSFFRSIFVNIWEIIQRNRPMNICLKGLIISLTVSWKEICNMFVKMWISI